MNTNELRNGFREYMQKRFPNDNNISSTISMAFFLERYGDEFDIDFHRVLSERIIPNSYRQKLEVHFTGSKNPRGRASIYERSLRLLLEYLDGKPVIVSNQPRMENRFRTVSSIVTAPKIPQPTKDAVEEYLDKWMRLPGYTAQEDALRLLFQETFPRNTSLSEVLVKCSTLNDFYGTNIFQVFPLAKHIVGLDIDSRLAKGDSQLVNNISLGHGIMSRSGKELHLFSFATKYCSHHNPQDFPIFDSYVEKLLIYFRNADRFSSFRNDELRDYLVFKRVILDFRKAYHLQDFNLKQIDQYLWQLGKDVFPKQYGKNERNNISINRVQEVEPTMELEKRFCNDMENATREAAKLGYTPTYFLNMVHTMGSYQAAKQLIHKKGASSGLTSLWKLGRLDLSIEAHAIKPEYEALFTADERRICAERLESFGYKTFGN